MEQVGPEEGDPTQDPHPGSPDSEELGASRLGCVSSNPKEGLSRPVVAAQWPVLVASPLVLLCAWVVKLCFPSREGLFLYREKASGS